MSGIPTFSKKHRTRKFAIWKKLGMVRIIRKTTKFRGGCHKLEKRSRKVPPFFGNCELVEFTILENWKNCKMVEFTFCGKSGNWE